MLEIAVIGSMVSAAKVGASVSTTAVSSATASTIATVSTAASVFQKAAAATPTPVPTPIPSAWSTVGFSASGGQIMEMFKLGGPFMWPILFASFIGAVYLFDRLVSLSIEAKATNKILKSLEALACRVEIKADQIENCCKEFDKSPIATMSVAAMEKYRAGEINKIESAMNRAGQAEMGRLEKGLPALASVSNIAPLIGFLGTVWGIILAFHVIGMKKVVNPQDISEGISQALIMSAAGLAVAIPASGAYNYFATRVSRIAVMMQEGAYLLGMLFSMMTGELDGPDETFAAEKCIIPPPEASKK